MSKVTGEEFKKKHGLKSVEMDGWYSANDHMKKNHEVERKREEAGRQAREAERGRTAQRISVFETHKILLTNLKQLIHAFRYLI